MVRQNLEVARAAYDKARKECWEFYKSSGVQAEERRISNLSIDEDGNDTYDENDNWIGKGPEPSKEEQEFNPALQEAHTKYRELLRIKYLARITFLEAGGGPVEYPGELDHLRSLWLNH